MEGLIEEQVKSEAHPERSHHFLGVALDSIEGPFDNEIQQETSLWNQIGLSTRPVRVGSFLTDTIFICRDHYIMIFPIHSSLLLFLFIPIAWYLANLYSQRTSLSDENLEKINIEEPICNTFLAPSSVEDSGWGVYAGRSFKKHDIVDIAPLYVRFQDNESVVRNSVLNDYTYGCNWTDHDAKSSQQCSAVVFGNSLFLNHHATPNLKLVHFPDHRREYDHNRAWALGWVAARDIEAGEELFTTYGEEDVGQEWFHARGIEQRESKPSTSRKTDAVFAADSFKYCAKTIAGIGDPGWNKVSNTRQSFPLRIGKERFHENDHPSAIIRHDVVSGTFLEMAPALILSGKVVRNTALAPLCIFWNDLNIEQKEIMISLHVANEWIVQYQGVDTEWKRQNRFDGWDDVVILPVAGNIGLVRRVTTNEQPNCKLEISSSGSMVSAGAAEGHSSVKNHSYAGIILTLIATRDLKSGEMLLLDLPSSASENEMDLLHHELTRTDQPIPDHIHEMQNGNHVNQYKV